MIRKKCDDVATNSLGRASFCLPFGSSSRASPGPKRCLWTRTGLQCIQQQPPSGPAPSPCLWGWATLWREAFLQRRRATWSWSRRVDVADVGPLHTLLTRLGVVLGAGHWIESKDCFHAVLCRIILAEPSCPSFIAACITATAAASGLEPPADPLHSWNSALRANDIDFVIQLSHEQLNCGASLSDVWFLYYLLFLNPNQRFIPVPF